MCPAKNYLKNPSHILRLFEYKYTGFVIWHLLIKRNRRWVKHSVHEINLILWRMPKDKCLESYSFFFSLDNILSTRIFLFFYWQIFITKCFPDLLYTLWPRYNPSLIFRYLQRDFFFFLSHSVSTFFFHFLFLNEKQSSGNRNISETGML